MTARRLAGDTFARHPLCSFPHGRTPTASALPRPSYEIRLPLPRPPARSGSPERDQLVGLRVEQGEPPVPDGMASTPGIGWPTPAATTHDLPFVLGGYRRAKRTHIGEQSGPTWVPGY